MPFRIRTTLLALAATSLGAATLAAMQPGNTANAQATRTTTIETASLTELLTPQNSTLLLIDYQPQMFFGVQSHDRQTIRNNVAGLSRAAQVFEVPTILTTVASDSFSGPQIKEISDVFPNQPRYDRTSMNAWDDARVVKAVKDTGRPKLIVGALWTEVCLTMPVLEALGEGFEVYIVTDASGGTSVEAHDMAVQRMVQAGAVPVTWQQVMLEWQRDWANQSTYDAVLDIARDHSGAYGIGIDYAFSMFGASEGKAGK